MSALVPPPRLLPIVGDDNRWFWTAGTDGTLKLWRCQTCGWWYHPPHDICFKCLGREFAPEPVSGDATVFTFTINRHEWRPGESDPYVIALVELPEQEFLRLTTNIEGCAPEDVFIGMPVRVAFEQHDDIYIPVFVPAP